MLSQQLANDQIDGMRASGLLGIFNTGSKGSQHVKSLFWIFRFTVRCLSIFSLKYQIPGMKNKKAQSGVIFYFSHPLFEISCFISSKNGRFLWTN